MDLRHRLPVRGMTASASLRWGDETMATAAKIIALTIAVTTVQLLFLLAWTVIVGIGGAALFTVAFAALDWIAGIARWEDAYAAHLGAIIGQLAIGLTFPAGAALGLYRFIRTEPRVFGMRSLPDQAQLAVLVVYCVAGADLTGALLYLSGGAFLRHFTSIVWAGGPTDDNAFYLVRVLRGWMLVLFAAGVFQLAKNADR